MSRNLLPPARDAISLTIGNFHDAPLKFRRLEKNVYPTAVDRNNVLEVDPIYMHHPSPRQDLQSPLALTPLSPAHSSFLIENQYLTGVHSAKDLNVSTYTIFMYLSHDADHKTIIKRILINQLVHMQSAGLPTSPEGLNALQVQDNYTCSVQPEHDDEPITNTTQVTPSQLNTCPYSFTITLPTFSIAAHGLLLLASRQMRWSTSIPDSLIPTFITQTIRQAILQQTPTTIRSNTNAPRHSMDACSITSLAFASLRPTECYRIFKGSAFYTLHKLVTAAEYRYHHERATSAAELSPPLQALLQILDAAQPATV